MAKTYRITIEYTTTNVTEFGPDYWDWPEILDLDPTRETFGLLSVSCLPNVNEDHVREIKEFADA
jgi:hypothetical protein